MRILGIDQSFTSCGCVVIDDSNTPTFFTRFVSSKADQTIDRAKWIVDQIADVIDTHQPNYVCFEGLALGIRAGDATRDLAGLMFMMWSMCRHKKGFGDESLRVYAPTSVKKFATGSGKADKKEMITQLPHSVMQGFLDAGYLKTKGLPDLADAYWIASYGLSEFKKGSTLATT